MQHEVRADAGEQRHHQREVVELAAERPATQEVLAIGRVMATQQACIPYRTNRLRFATGPSEVALSADAGFVGVFITASGHGCRKASPDGRTPAS